MELTMGENNGGGCRLFLDRRRRLQAPGIYRTADVLFFVLYGVHLAQWQAPGSVVTITANSLVLPRTLLNAAPGTGATATVTARGTLPCTRA